MNIYRLLFASTIIKIATGNDGWEFYGGKKKINRHGLNKAVGKQNHTFTEQTVIFQTDDNVPTETKENSKSKPKKGIFKNLKSPNDYPMLPERFSVLKFDRLEGEDDFAPKEDFDEEFKQESESFWGRLYFDGFPDPIGMQYFRAHFGAKPTSEIFELILASPVNMCNEHFKPVFNNSGNFMTNNTYILAFRGVCTFAEKARLALSVGASGLVFINNEEGNFHPSGPEGHDLNVSVSMITRADGMRLMDALLNEEDFPKTESNGLGLRGIFVPMKCTHEQSKTNPDLQHPCEPVRHFHRDLVSKLYDEKEGKIVLALESDEVLHSTFYVQADFGSRIRNGQTWSLSRAQTSSQEKGKDLTFCSENTLSQSNNHGEYKNKALLIQRGGCDFTTKAKILSDAGAGLMVLANTASENNNTEIFAMGANTTYFGSKIRVAAIMISHSSFVAMSKQIQETTGPLVFSLHHPSIIFGSNNTEIDMDESSTRIKIGEL